MSHEKEEKKLIPDFKPKAEIKSIEIVLPALPTQSNFSESMYGRTSAGFVGSTAASPLIGRRVIDFEMIETRLGVREGNGDNTKRFTTGRLGTVIKQDGTTSTVLLENGMTVNSNVWNLYWFPNTKDEIDKEILAYRKRIIFLELRKEYMEENKLTELDEIVFLKKMIGKFAESKESLAKLLDLVLNLIKAIK